MFRDVIVGENDFLSIVEKHTGGTVKRVFKDGYRNQILNINFNEEEVEKRFTHPTYGHLEYSLDDGTVAMSGLKYEEEKDYCLFRLYQKDHPEVAVVAVTSCSGGCFLVKVRTNE